VRSFITFTPSIIKMIKLRRMRWVDNIKMDLREIGWDDLDWIHVAQDRNLWRAHVNMVMNLQVP
jgi:hypothetical protein